MRMLIAFVVGCSWTVTVALAADPQPPARPSVQPASPATNPAAARSSAKPTDIEKFVQEFAEAFQQGDSQVLAAHFAPEGRYINGDSGRRTEGREAISALHSSVFQPQQIKSFEIAVDEVRPVTPDVATVDATATLVRQDGAATESLLHAVLVRKEGKWQIDSLQEASVPVNAPVQEGLAELAWLIGDWKDAAGPFTVETQCKWLDGKTFIERTYRVSEDGKLLHHGRQIIGFDTVDGMIRSWNFESDGSFGEGVWSYDGTAWTVRLRGRTASGLEFSATQVITPQSVDEFTTQMVGRELGGKMLANSPLVKVKRVVTEK